MPGDPGRKDNGTTKNSTVEAAGKREEFRSSGDLRLRGREDGEVGRLWSPLAEWPQDAPATFLQPADLPAVAATEPSEEQTDGVSQLSFRRNG